MPDGFVELVKSKAKEAIETRSLDVTSERKILLNQLIGLEKRRDVIEKKYADDKIDHEVYLRLHGSVQAEIDGINQRIADIQNNRVLDLNLIEEVLNMTRDIHKTYQNAPDFMTQLYLRFFFERIEIKNKKVSKYIATPTFQALMEGHKVLKLTAQLPNVSALRTFFLETEEEFEPIFS